MKVCSHLSMHFSKLIDLMMISNRRIPSFGFILLAFTLVSLIPEISIAKPFLREGVPLLKSETIEVPSFSNLVKTLGPSVVNISTESDGKRDVEEFTIPGLPFQFRPEMNVPVRSLGSGFIVHEDGYVVTNNHVVEKADKIIVRLLDDKEEYRAKLIGRDPKTDLALLKIKPKRTLTPVLFGNSDDLAIGDWVLAIGNPFQLGQTVTAGIVSAKSRKVPSGGPYDDFIQTDASINPGNSGGPLFNTAGQVVGINTAIYSPGRSQVGGAGFNIGIGFAIPVNLAKGVLEQLRTSGKVTRGWLGVLIQRVSPDVAEALGLKSYNGALVADVVEDSPAAKAGLQRGDVIVKYDGQVVSENDDLPLMVANTKIDSSAKLEIIRKGSRKTVVAKITELRDEKSINQAQESRKNDIGVAVQNLTPEIAKSLKLKSRSGVVVSEVQPSSPAASAGIVRGDVIEEVAGEPIANVDDFQSVVRKLKKGKPVLVLVRRSVGTLYLTLKLE